MLVYHTGAYNVGLALEVCFTRLCKHIQVVAGFQGCNYIVLILLQFVECCICLGKERRPLGVCVCVCAVVTMEGTLTVRFACGAQVSLCHNLVLPLTFNT